MSINIRSWGTRLCKDINVAPRRKDKQSTTHLPPTRICRRIWSRLSLICGWWGTRGWSVGRRWWRWGSWRWRRITDIVSIFSIILWLSLNEGPRVWRIQGRRSVCEIFIWGESRTRKPISS
jgi:hypothetical protein